MLSVTVSSVIGLAIGLLTGFFFERRSTRIAQAQNEELKRQLRELRASVYSVGGRTTAPISNSFNYDDLASRVLIWVKNVQNSSGSVDMNHLIVHFTREGYSRDDVQQALAQLSSDGALRLREGRVEVA